MHGSRAVPRDVLIAASLAVVACAVTVGIGAQQPTRAAGRRDAGTLPGLRHERRRRDHPRRDADDVRHLVHAVGYREGRWADARAGVRGRQRRVPTLHARRRAAAESDARPADVAAMMAALPDAAPAKPAAAAQGARPRPGRGLRPLVDPARGAHDRRDRQEDRRVDDDDHLQRGRHQRRQPEAVRRHLPGEHHRGVPRRSGTPRRPRRDARRCSTSSAAARGSPASTPRPTPITSSTAPGAAAAGRDQPSAVSPVVLQMLEGDQERRRPADARGVHGVADAWFDKLDTDKSGRVDAGGVSAALRSDLRRRRCRPGAAVQRPGAATNLGPDTEVGTWPEFNQMIGGFFKFHWNDGQTITVKIDDPSTR